MYFKIKLNIIIGGGVKSNILLKLIKEFTNILLQTNQISHLPKLIHGYSADIVFRYTDIMFLLLKCLYINLFLI